MKKVNTFLLGLLLLVVFLASGCQNNGASSDREDLLAGLGLEQKIGQMFLIGIQGTEITNDAADQIRAIHPGGIILFGKNIQDAGHLKAFIDSLQKIATDDGGYPLFIAVDQEGGEIVRIKWINDDIGQADIKDSDQAYRMGYNRAKSLKNLGINQILGPVLDIGQSGDFLTRYKRCLQGNAEEVGAMGKSIIAGQNDGGMLSTAKHFPGYGGISFDPENERLAVMSQVPEISQFETALEAGPQFVMGANVIYEDIDPLVPFALSASGIDFLYEELGNDFIVITDDLASKVLKAEYSLAGTVVMAAKAGGDMLLFSGDATNE